MTIRSIHFRGVAIILAIAICATLAPVVSAQNTTLNVWIGPPPVDVCPNIAGIQISPPVGMIIDGNGDCITPTPPPVDVCPNIAGLQTTIPNGYYQDSNGDCQIQPIPPVDVCPNIYGLQIIVPSGLMVDALGNCIAPPIDECPNIPGDQPIVPAGMVFENGACLTPPGAVSPPTPPAPPIPQETEYTPTIPSAPNGYTGSDYKNVPAALDPVIDPIVKIIPREIRKTLQSVPPDVARSVPYYVTGVLGAIATLVAIQAIFELYAARSLLFLLRRDKNIADQKDNFIALASHYLRTPLTLMLNGLDTIVALKELPLAAIEPLKLTVSVLDRDIKSILADVENNTVLQGIHAPDTATTSPNVLRSRYFWGPIISAILFIWGANFLLGVVGNIELGSFNLIMQSLLFVAIAYALYIAVRNRFIKRQQRLKQEHLIANEHAIDEARNEFIQRSTAVLEQGLSALMVSRPAINGAPSARFFDEGYQRFNEILEKFLLLSEIQTGRASAKETINLHDLVDDTISSLQATIEEKSLTVTNDVDTNISVDQNRALFSFIIKSLLDNAIKFNHEHGTITIKSNPSRQTIRIHVSDNGIGIPKDKLPQLFKPFSRAGSAIEFNYEGLGFSLFLDKIITDYMGGTIKATTPEKGGTSVIVTTQKALAGKH